MWKVPLSMYVHYGDELYGTPETPVRIIYAARRSGVYHLRPV